MKRILGYVLLVVTLILAIQVVGTNAVTNVTSEKKAFRLLALECLEDGRATQRLISALLSYPNWNNNTDFTAYIHLLSFLNETEISEECRPFYVGTPTAINVHNEIYNFLGSADENEIIIFYYNGHGPAFPGAIDLIEWLDCRNQAQMNANLCIILDTCGSGRYIRSPYTPEGSLTNQTLVMTSGTGGQVSYDSYFTNGIITSLEHARDANRDGWLSFKECWNFAAPRTSGSDSDFYNGLPDQYDPPLVPRLVPSVHDIGIMSVSVSKQFVCQGSNVTISVEIENFGDFEEGFDVTVYFGGLLGPRTKAVVASGNVTVAELKFEATLPKGNYTMFVWVTIENADEYYGSDNTLSDVPMVVSMTGDINRDDRVNIVDIAIVAKAFGSYPGRESWNANLDMDEDQEIDETDLLFISEAFIETI